MKLKIVSGFLLLLALLAAGSVSTKFNNRSTAGGYQVLAQDGQTQKFAPRNGVRMGATGQIVFRVKTVQPDSPAAQAGLQPGDLILTMNSQQIESIQDVWDALQGSSGKPVEISFFRLNKETGLYEENKTQVTPK